ncbi:hypothetical protein Pla123a_37250 [Posidoniimonas polymericola]|uniref:Uncharacterized protein n=1 Tax=Posidoniimonas polymericola TaxID=2528002 RepID=A0A5C5YGU8_9BACT|nr:hypothetical protein [Posidoniimonas polymericola]TWT73831.1 hypothetical protein Pla123a_37250 [Posidoniimonas polymericola]
MAWLFERTVELAAWTAMFVAWISAACMLYWAYLWVATLNSEPDHQLLVNVSQWAAAFVGFSVALGALACIDRFLFDADEK